MTLHRFLKAALLVLSAADKPVHSLTSLNQLFLGRPLGLFPLILPSNAVVRILFLGLGCMRSLTVRVTVTRQTSGPVVSSFSLFSVETFLSKRGRFEIRIIWRQENNFLNLQKSDHTHEANPSRKVEL